MNLQPKYEHKLLDQQYKPKKKKKKKCYFRGLRKNYDVLGGRWRPTAGSYEIQFLFKKQIGKKNCLRSK